MCNQKIQEHPEQYTKALDPVTRAIVDKASAFIFAFQGRAYYFESQSSRSEFAKQPLKYIAGTHKRSLIEVSDFATHRRDPL